ncbi:MAG: PRC-barrel domain-containing protein [Verrucomicrobiota bacterium]
MDKERLKSAPSFNKSHWPDMTDQLWNSQVYSFYGAQPYWKNSPAVSTTRATINEPADAEFSTRINTTEIYPEVYGESETDLSPSRHPRKGLGAEDLTQNEQRLNTPKGFAVSEVFVQEPSGAETKRPSVAPTTTIEESETLKTASPSEIGTAKIHKAKRASELIGMEVKNAQDERIGEIKDLVVDLKTGRVAYTVLEAGGLLEVDKLYAVPPSVFTRSSDERWLVFNTDKETLKSAPGFEKNNWPQAGDHKFTTEVYRFSHQRPYWQSSDEIREPAGSEPRTKRQESRDESQKPPTGGQSRRD